MQRLGRVRDTKREMRLFRERMRFLMIMMSILFLVLLMRLVHLQIFMGDHYSTLSWQNRVKLLPIPPQRGLIYSHDGKLIASNRISYDLTLVPEQVLNIQQAMEELGEILNISDQQRQNFLALLKRSKSFKEIELIYDLDDGEMARFMVNRHRFPGVRIVQNFLRHYPEGSLYAHVLGYVGRIDERDQERVNKRNYLATTHIGKLGVERAYEDVLHGQVGYQQVEVNAHGRIVRVLERKEPISGKTLHLTINSALQRAAVQQLSGRRGAIVAIDPRNGALLASVSSPTFDPNLFVQGISHEDYQSLLNSPDLPLFNRFLQGEYPPGSTWKPFLGLLALEVEARSSESRSWCPGFLQVENILFRDWARFGHGDMDLHNAIAQSCDVYFYRLSLDFGIQGMSEGMRKFGFGKPTGVRLLGERSGLMPSRKWKQRVHDRPWYPGDTVQTGIGQGYSLATPLQLANATAVLANGGRLFTPHLLEGEMDTSPVEMAIGNSAHVDIVIDAMRAVVHEKHGTAYQSGIGAEYEFAGKTGTAQVFSLSRTYRRSPQSIAEKLQDHALFVAMAPLPAPEIAVAIIVENGGSGSKVAAPIARALFDSYLAKEEGD
ncbi:MAG: penicillin-binding protein 2 [Candidatus Eutrophobiaceae bacterium]